MLQFLKHGGFSITSIRKPLIGGFRKKRNRSSTSTGARPDRKVRFILGELFDTWSWQPNDRKWFWLDGIESCCVGVEGSSKSICVRRFSPSALSLCRFHLSPFPQKPLILRLWLSLPWENRTIARIFVGFSLTGIGKRCSIFKKDEWFTMIRSRENELKNWRGGSNWPMFFSFNVRT